MHAGHAATRARLLACGRQSYVVSIIHFRVVFCCIGVVGGCAGSGWGWGGRGDLLGGGLDQTRPDFYCCDYRCVEKDKFAKNMQICKIRKFEIPEILKARKFRGILKGAQTITPQQLQYEGSSRQPPVCDTFFFRFLYTQSFQVHLLSEHNNSFFKRTADPATNNELK